MTTGQADAPPTVLTWFKSSYSGTSGGDCVEVAATPGAVHVRDSKDRSGPNLSFPEKQWTAFLAFVDASVV